MMMSSRRDFLLRTTVTAGSVLFGRDALVQSAARLIGGLATTSMNMLVLGGTGFIGPHLVRQAVSRGHRVTIFTRGRHQAELPNGVERLIGDRNGQLGALEGKQWD